MVLQTAARTIQVIVCPHCGTQNRVITGLSLLQSRCGKCHDHLSSREPMALGAARMDKFIEHHRGIFVLDIWTPWCGPCHRFAPVFSEAAHAYIEKIRFIKVDADENPAFLNRFNFRGVPTLLAWREGALASRHAGALSKDALFRWVQDLTKTTPSSFFKGDEK